MYIIAIKRNEKETEMRINPVAKALNKVNRPSVVKAKKGRGSYSRKSVRV